MNIERRTVNAEIRALSQEGRTFEAVVMKYDTVDDYDTVFDAGCFAESLDKRLPRITWAHDRNDLIGRVINYVDTPTSLTITGELDDFDAVPRARQAYAQLKSGTLDNYSVGFRRGETRDVEGRTHFATATLDEIALVLSGAVPGTETLAVREAPLSKLVMVRSGSVPIETLVEIAKQKAAGSLTETEAAVAIDLAAGTATATAVPTAGGDGDGAGTGAGAANPPVPDPTSEAADAALASLGIE